MGKWCSPLSKSGEDAHGSIFSFPQRIPALTDGAFSTSRRRCSRKRTPKPAALPKEHRCLNRALENLAEVRRRRLWAGWPWT